MQAASRAIVCAAISLLIAATAACTPVSEQPLSNEQNSKLDKRLLGKWEAKGTRTVDGPYTVNVRRRAQSATGLEAFDIIRDGNKKVEDTAPFYATKIGEQDYLTFETQVLDPKTNENKSEFVILRYRFIDDDTVAVFTMREELIVKAIADGQLKGRYFGPTTFTLSCVVITDSSENLRRYLKKHAAECFPRDRSDALFVFARSKE